MFDYAQTTILTYNDNGTPKKAFKFTKLSIGLEALTSLCDTISKVVLLGGQVIVSGLNSDQDL